jgi:TolA-binding protein
MQLEENMPEEPGRRIGQPSPHFLLQSPDILRLFRHGDDSASPARSGNAILASRGGAAEGHFDRVKLPAPFRFFAATFVLAAAVVAQEAAPEAGTARDVISRADAAYNEKKYDEAIAGYEKFLVDFGSSPEAAADLPHVRYNLSAALMQAAKFEAAAEATEEALKLEKTGEAQREDLSFWRAIALLQSGQADAAHAALVEFPQKFPRSPRRPDAALLSGNALLTADKKKEAAEVFGAIRKSPGHPHRGRAAVLELHCLLETGQDDKALELLAEEGPAQGENIIQIATFQTLALGLGEKMLEQDRQRDAIRALQNIWPRERLIERQKAALAQIEAQLAALENQPRPDVFRRGQLRQQQREVQKELANLEKIASFDASVRFRQATAFHQLDRFRECALLLEDMLRQMKPDAVVETASLSALQSWLAIERNDKAVEASELFEKNFPASKSLPLVLYLRGTAQQRAEEFDQAIATFEAVQERFPGTEQAPRAFFMKGFTQLLAERNEEAAATLGEFGQKHADHELAEAANYWRGSALAFAKKFPEAREVLAAHGEKFPKGNLPGPAAFRHAYCAQSMKDYPAAEAELKAYLDKYPEGQEANEARILLGDALLAQAKSDEGKEVYAGIPPEAGRFHEDAQFKIARVLKLEEDYEGLRALMGNYLEAYPKSPRAAEALFLIGQSWRQEDQPNKAIAEYWKAIGQFGNDPAAHSVEDLFLALGRLYKGESEKRDYLAELRSTREKAEAEDRKVLAVRTIWALGQAVKKTDPELSAALLREASAQADPEITSPMILSDGAEAQLAGAAAGGEEAAARRTKAAQLYRDLLKWHPRAGQKDKALAALGRLAMEDGDRETALDYYGRLERDTPWSSLMGEVLMTRAGIEKEAGRTDEAADAYTRLLAAENVPGKLKAQALLALGELEMARDRPQTAIPYYQRIYILYGKWRETVAQAYLRSGEAFEKINDLEAARRTYEELSNSEDLASLPEAQTARERLRRLGPPAADAASS